MSAEDQFSAQEFGAAFSRFLEWIEDGQTGQKGAPFATMLAEHFGSDPSFNPVTAATVPSYDLPNLQLALDSYLEATGVQHHLAGFAGAIEHYDVSLSGLVHDVGFGLKPGPVRHSVVPLETGRSVTCVNTGLFLISSGEERLAALITQGERGFDRPGVRLEVMAADEGRAEQFLSDIRHLMHEHNVYRGKILSLGTSGEWTEEGASVEFKSVPPVGREDIVLPEGVLESIELHTIEFARHSDALQKGLRHLRRGLLLHGRPGTGKTLTASYLISRLEGRTVVVLTGGGLGLIAEACSIARDLQPSLVILEDVDLIAYERTAMMGSTGLLFELLNQMDGIGEDADVIFLMTTNRADLLEPALAARPGRVDQAIELPLPDATSRDRLLELFSRGLEVQLDDRANLIAETEGASPAFLREVIRKAALYAAVAGDGKVSDQHFASAMSMLDSGGALTRSLLGAAGSTAFDRLSEGDEDWDFGAEDEE